ncbi:LysR family transcriptional regulator [Lentzea nigeriaca]
MTVARLGSFSVAAHELGYTQSAVSQQIAALETDLGVSLLRRRPVGPTEAGRRLLEHAGPILLRLDAARADVRRISGKQPVELRVGISPMADGEGLVERLAEVQRDMPHVTVTLSAGGADDVAAGVARGELEIGLVDGVVAPSDPLRLVEIGTFTTVVVSESPLVVVMPGDHPLATRAAVRLGDLADARWIDAPAASVPLTGLRVVADGFRAGLTYDGAERSVLLALVAAGAGLAVLPERVKRSRPDLVAVPLAAPALVHRTELVHGSLSSPAAAVVSQTMR